MTAELHEWTDEYDEVARPRYRYGGGTWDAVRYMECLPGWNCLPLANFSPDLVNDPSNCIQKHIEL
jgi:hypothetical protein